MAEEKERMSEFQTQKPNRKHLGVAFGIKQPIKLSGISRRFLFMTKTDQDNVATGSLGFSTIQMLKGLYICLLNNFYLCVLYLHYVIRNLRNEYLRPLESG